MSDISVIIPVYNDPEGLETTVESLFDQSADGYEIIIADNGSTDETTDIARDYVSHDHVTLVIEDEIQSSYAARNAGIRVATGDVLCFLDADMWVEPDWVTSVREFMQRCDADYVGCDVSIESEHETIFAKYNSQSGFRVESYIENHQFAPTCCLIVRREVIKDVGNFDQRLVSSGDYEFGRRVHRAGYRQRFAEDLLVYHPARESLSALLKKHYRVGRGWLQRARLHPDLCKGRHPLNPINFCPDPPTSIYRKFEGQPISRLITFYLIAYLLRLCKATGQIREWTTHKQLTN